MTYTIFKTKSGPQLGWYEYHWPSDSFSVGLGTTRNKERHCCDLNYEILARLSFQRRVVCGAFTYQQTYPENNFLIVNLEEGTKQEDLPDIPQMKGFKKFFGDKNIKDVIFV